MEDAGCAAHGVALLCVNCRLRVARPPLPTVNLQLPLPAPLPIVARDQR